MVTPTTPFDLPPTIQVADREIEESHPRGYITATVSEILAQSSNVGAVMIGLALNDEFGDPKFGDRFDTWIRRFGFGEPTGVELPGEERGIVVPPDEYSGSTMGNLPIGQGLSVTPMQMAAGYAAIADDGVLRTPRLVLEEVGAPVEPGPRAARDQPRQRRQGARDARGRARAGRHRVRGRGSRLHARGQDRHGGEGGPENGTYSETEYVASFVGFAPAEDPRLLVAIVVDEPKGDYYGGTVAAPAFGEIAGFALPYLGIPPDQG